MATVTCESGLVKVSLRKAAGLVNRARRVWLDLIPACVTVRLTKRSARNYLRDLRARGVRRVSVHLSADNVGFWTEAAR
jgi:hypothetical protein